MTNTTQTTVFIVLQEDQSQIEEKVIATYILEVFLRDDDAQAFLRKTEKEVTALNLDYESIIWIEEKELKT
tara:strand:+ start:380 stop:592 length:213 start_codon:yes stop_codon:yes gene_type:complete